MHRFNNNHTLLTLRNEGEIIYGIVFVLTFAI